MEELQKEVEQLQKGIEQLQQVQQGGDVFFILMGAILVFAMHGGFAFLEVGTVRHKNQVNALVKILVDFRDIDRVLLLHWLLGCLRHHVPCQR